MTSIRRLPNFVQIQRSSFISILNHLPLWTTIPSSSHSRPKSVRSKNNCNTPENSSVTPVYSSVAPVYSSVAPVYSSLRRITCSLIIKRLLPKKIISSQNSLPNLQSPKCYMVNTILSINKLIYETFTVRFTDNIL